MPKITFNPFDLFGLTFLTIFESILVGIYIASWIQTGKPLPATVVSVGFIFGGFVFAWGTWVFLAIRWWRDRQRHPRSVAI